MNKLYYGIAFVAMSACVHACAMTKMGVTQAQANQDAYECRREARMINRGAVFDAYRDCMHARGYK